MVAIVRTPSVTVETVASPAAAVASSAVSVLFEPPHPQSNVAAITTDNESAKSFFNFMGISPF